MRHLAITEYGQFVGVTGQRLVVRDADQTVLETPLSRLRSVAIVKDGVSFSSNLILACAARGIRLYVLDWRGQALAALSGQHRHGISELRKQQFAFIDSPQSRYTAAGMIYGKLRNQRAVLLYFGKYHQKHKVVIREVAEHIAELARRLQHTDWEARASWREEIMGIEGAAAAAYWQLNAKTGWLGPTFLKRTGRGATDLSNQLLNYGYALLASYIWSALDNAGFELYAGVLHAERAGKPSLVLDMMEEYRPWVVDRQVIAMRSKIKEDKRLNYALKKQLSGAIQTVMDTRYIHRGKRLKLETIVQRQAYRLAASMVKGQRYQPYRFKW